MTQSPYDPQPTPGAPRAHDPYGQDPFAHGAQPQGAPAHGSPGAAPQGSAGAPGPAPGTDLGADLGAGLRFARDAMLRNPVAFIVPGVIYGVLAFVLIIGATILGFVLAAPQIEAAAYSEDPPLGVFLTIYGLIALGGLASMPLMWFWQSGAVRAGAEVIAGRRPSFGQAMIGTGRILLTMLLVTVIVWVGLVLFYIPGLIASVLLAYALPASARGARPVEAIKESFSLVKNNLVTVIVAALVIAAIGTVAGFLVITLVVIIPFTVLFQQGIYERLSGRELAEPVRA
ncbi:MULTISPECIES: hypothetical protein [Brachybacterium]|uniref:Glycerophosphoryl diester phosphodiesterase membrane domain-containing protein n=1 Tax=Brachybacterium conglomeratum TaxID=47846 RepID=A0ABQ5RLT7_9MICO|nr:MULTISPECIES: hypothetical protein [Brachybacterium]GLI32236.1 hypothetical protein BCONGLO52_30770 [Brachybacterium conglomeratum]GLK03770.1 hypothetical protein GCM10017597_05690 [Brachybacterium conglomeratum]